MYVYQQDWMRSSHGFTTRPQGRKMGGGEVKFSPRDHETGWDHLMVSPRDHEVGKWGEGNVNFSPRDHKTGWDPLMVSPRDHEVGKGVGVGRCKIFTTRPWDWMRSSHGLTMRPRDWMRSSRVENKNSRWVPREDLVVLAPKTQKIHHEILDFSDIDFILKFL